MRKPRAALAPTWFIVAASIVLGAIIVGFVMFIQSLQ